MKQDLQEHQEQQVNVVQEERQDHQVNLEAMVQQEIGENAVNQEIMACLDHPEVVDNLEQMEKGEKEVLLAQLVNLVLLDREDNQVNKEVQVPQDNQENEGHQD